MQAILKRVVTAKFRIEAVELGTERAASPAESISLTKRFTTRWHSPRQASVQRQTPSAAPQQHARSQEQPVKEKAAARGARLNIAATIDYK
jgi:hypothetical protein